MTLQEKHPEKHCKEFEIFGISAQINSEIFGRYALNPEIFGILS